MASLPVLNSETGVRTFFLKTTQVKGKPLDLFRMIGIEGWGTAESLFNPVLDNQSILLMGKLRCQGHPEPGLEPWHQAMTREAGFLGLSFIPWAWRQRLELEG